MYSIDKEKLKKVPTKMAEMNEKIADGVGEKLKGGARPYASAVALLALLGVVSILSIVIEAPIKGTLMILALFAIVMSPIIIKKIKEKEDAPQSEESVDESSDSTEEKEEESEESEDTSEEKEEESKE
jgi:hypothetical protein